MAYKISYGQDDGSVKPAFDLRKCGIILAVAAVICCAMIVQAVGLPWVRDVLLPGDPAVTAAALDTLLDSLREGIPIRDAIEVFCREIIAHAS